LHFSLVTNAKDCYPDKPRDFPHCIQSSKLKKRAKEQGLTTADENGRAEKIQASHALVKEHGLYQQLMSPNVEP
jgi:hypothetical protein